MRLYISAHELHVTHFLSVACLSIEKQIEHDQHFQLIEKTKVFLQKCLFYLNRKEKNYKQTRIISLQTNLSLCRQLFARIHPISTASFFD